jgi:hypothetical protein
MTTRRRQQGVALILMATLLVMGVAWFAIGAGKSRSVTEYEREAKTGAALREAKAALLAYAAQYAARSNTAEPGQMPCPESTNYFAAGTEGQASTSCSNANESVGRLPWRTLGIDQLRDGYGEPLWYVLSRGFRNPPINFGTFGQINYNGSANAAVALIIAPGRVVNTLSDPGTPPAACAKVNQGSSNRNATTGPLDPTKFLECSNAIGPYGNPGNMANWSTWSNDRVIAITSQEWADAIASAIADRLQRQTLPALRNWETAEAAATGKSWASTWSAPYQPFAVTFANPNASTFCGSGGVREGLVPLAAWSTTDCDVRWTGSASALLNLLSLGCSQQATYLSCQFLGLLGIGGTTITATAPNIANGYRGTLTAADISVSGGGTVGASSLSISSATGAATLTVQVTFPLLALLQAVEVRIPYVADANVLSDSRVTWVTNNNWQRYLYYAVAPGATVSPTSACAAAGDPGCITVAGLAASTGATNDKRVVLALSGRPIGTQVQPSANRTDYFESRVSATQFTSATVTSTYNDRLAACPFQFTMQSGATTTICN